MVIRHARLQVRSAGHLLSQSIDQHARQVREQLEAIFRRIEERLGDTFERLGVLRVAIAQVNPDNVLRRGYALLRGEVGVGNIIELETIDKQVTAEVRDVREK